MARQSRFVKALATALVIALLCASSIFAAENKKTSSDTPADRMVEDTKLLIKSFLRETAFIKSFSADSPTQSVQPLDLDAAIKKHATAIVPEKIQPNNAIEALKESF